MTSDCFRLIEPVPTAEAIPSWARHFAHFDSVVGYSSLGHAFLANLDTGDYAILYPYRAGATGYGPFVSVWEFADQVLTEPRFADFVLRPDHVSEICDRLGPLAAGQVYAAKPYPFQGGNEAPDSYQLADLWTFLDQVAEAHGL
ncbi:hypothetical protein ACWDSJ_22370 [Nocardia sp. NPDC003482]|uniref:hypothetical protein n=1 Tax=Nocardia sp. NPDC004068 TaxID=3364303 RepID=UPI0036BE6B64